MNLQKFFSGVWSDIKSIFDNMSIEVKTSIHTGILVTEAIKTFVDSPVADVLTAIIPGDTDDRIKELLRKKLPVILTELKLADSCSELTDPIQITACAIKVLQCLDSDIKSAFLHNISILIAQVAADGKLSWSDGVMILEWYYQNRYKTAA